jgi:hypothetical protein
MNRRSILVVALLYPFLASAQLTVTISSPKIAANKAVVSLAMKNNFTEKIESARATVFLLDDQGKMIAQATKWVIGGSTNRPGLAAGATNSFYFVVQSSKPIQTTNLTAKITFNRLVLDGGKIVDANKNVEIKS